MSTVRFPPPLVGAIALSTSIETALHFTQLVYLAPVARYLRPFGDPRSRGSNRAVHMILRSTATPLPPSQTIADTPTCRAPPRAGKYSPTTAPRRRRRSQVRCPPSALAAAVGRNQTPPFRIVSACSYPLRFSYVRYAKVEFYPGFLHVADHKPSLRYQLRPSRLTWQIELIPQDDMKLLAD